MIAVAKEPAKRAGNAVPALLEHDPERLELGGHAVVALRGKGAHANGTTWIAATEVARWLGYFSVAGLTKLADRHPADMAGHRSVSIVETEVGARRVVVFSPVGAIKLAFLSETSKGVDMRDALSQWVAQKVAAVARAGSHVSAAQDVLIDATARLEAVRDRAGPKPVRDALDDVVASLRENTELLEVLTTKRLPRAAGSIALGPQLAYLLGAKRPDRKGEAS